jgi:hypothetical protein
MRFAHASQSSSSLPHQEPAGIFKRIKMSSFLGLFIEHQPLKKFAHLR